MEVRIYRNDAAQAAAEYTRAQSRLKTLGVTAQVPAAERGTSAVWGLSMRLPLFKNEGLAPDAAKRIAKFFAGAAAKTQ